MKEADQIVEEKGGADLLEAEEQQLSLGLS